MSSTLVVVLCRSPASRLLLTCRNVRIFAVVLSAIGFFFVIYFRCCCSAVRCDIDEYYDCRRCRFAWYYCYRIESHSTDNYGPATALLAPPAPAASSTTATAQRTCNYAAHAHQYGCGGCMWDVFGEYAAYAAYTQYAWRGTRTAGAQDNEVGGWWWWGRRSGRDTGVKREFELLPRQA